MANSKIIAIGKDRFGNEVAFKYACTDAGCNCMKTWISGNADQVVTWIDLY